MYVTHTSDLHHPFINVTFDNEGVIKYWEESQTNPFGGTPRIVSKKRVENVCKLLSVPFITPSMIQPVSPWSTYYTYTKSSWSEHLGIFWTKHFHSKVYKNHKKVYIWGTFELQVTDQNRRVPQSCFSWLNSIFALYSALNHKNIICFGIPEASDRVNHSKFFLLLKQVKIDEYLLRRFESYLPIGTSRWGWWLSLFGPPETTRRLTKWTDLGVIPLIFLFRNGCLAIWTKVNWIPFGFQLIVLRGGAVVFRR